MIKHIKGFGLHTGAPVDVEITKTSDNLITINGITVNSDNVNGSNLCTQIGGVRCIEHLMSALWYKNYTGISINVRSEKSEYPYIDLPILDGSSSQWIDILDEIDCCQNTSQIIITKEKNLILDDKMITVEPSETFKVKYVYDNGKYKQLYEFEESQYADIRHSRTFCFEGEIGPLLSMGFGRSSDKQNTLILDDRLNPINPNENNDRQEFIKHKVLDFIGDMYCAGMRIRGTFYCVRTGHLTNNLMLKSIIADKSCYSIETK